MIDIIIFGFCRWGNGGREITGSVCWLLMASRRQAWGAPTMESGQLGFYSLDRSSCLVVVCEHRGGPGVDIYVRVGRPLWSTGF